MGISGIILIQHIGWNSLQHLLRKYPQQLPANLQGLKHGAIFVNACTKTVVSVDHVMAVP